VPKLHSSVPAGAIRRTILGIVPPSSRREFYHGGVNSQGQFDAIERQINSGDRADTHQVRPPCPALTDAWP
jgi:hypothetical protein